MSRKANDAGALKSQNDYFRILKLCDIEIDVGPYMLTKF